MSNNTSNTNSVRPIQLTISAIAIVVAVIHLIFPDIKIDAGGTGSRTCAA